MMKRMEYSNIMVPECEKCSALNFAPCCFVVDILKSYVLLYTFIVVVSLWNDFFLYISGKYLNIFEFIWNLYYMNVVLR